MFKILLILAFAIRVVLMPISAHADLFFINEFPNLLLTDGVFNIADHIEKNFGSRNYTYYSPIVYFTFAAFQSFYGLFSSTFSPWMSELYKLELAGASGQAADFLEATNNSQIHKDLFLAKTPYLLFDLASIFVLAKFIKSKILKRSSILLWLFNPVNLYSTYLIGQFDIIPVFFTLTGFYLLRKNPILGFLTLGLAAAFKNYAFIFILPTAVIYGQTWKDRIKYLITSFFPYLIFLSPTIISGFQQALYQILPKVYLHYRKPLEGWALYSQFIKYIVLSISYLFILLLSLTLKVKDRWRLAIALSLVSILLAFAIAPRISFHYLMWAVPPLILWFKNVKIATYIIIGQTLGLAAYKLLANHLQLGLFSPLNPGYFSQLPTVNSLIDRYIPYYLISGFGFFFFLLVNLISAATILNYLFFKSPVKRS